MTKSRTFLLAVLGMMLGCAGCSDNTGSDAQSVGTNAASESSSPLTAPVDYLGAVGKAQQTAIKVSDIASVNQAIQLFNVEHGRYPNTLQELVDEKMLPRLPDLPRGMKYSYDSSKGAVKIVPQ